MEALHLCENCAFKRKPIETSVEIDPTDCQVYERIMTMLVNTDQSAQIPAPENLSPAERKEYFKNVIGSGDNARALVNEWWALARQKYGVPNCAHFDKTIPEFYVCVDDKGNINTTDDFIPKTQE